MPAPQRSWNEQQSAGSPRAALLAILGLIVCLGIALFLYVVWNIKQERVIVRTINFTKYSPNVVGFGRANEGNRQWSAKELVGAAFEAGLVSWVEDDPGGELDGTSAFLQELERKVAKGTDLFVVPLRCHAAVAKIKPPAQGDKNQWSLELLTRQDDTKTGQCSFEAVLDKLIEQPCKNILILADVCDLSYVPENGWIRNPVATYLRKGCEAWREKNIAKERTIPNIWIICSANDGQTAFTDLTSRSLFQSACCRSLNGDIGPNVEPFPVPVTLKEYFENIDRILRRATFGQQCPQLILLNSKREIFDSRNALNEAARLKLSRRFSTSFNTKKVTQEAAPSESATKASESADPVPNSVVEGKESPFRETWGCRHVTPLDWRIAKRIAPELEEEEMLRGSLPSLTILSDSDQKELERRRWNTKRLRSETNQEWQQFLGDIPSEERNAITGLKEFTEYMDIICQLTDLRDLAVQLPQIDDRHSTSNYLRPEVIQLLRESTRLKEAFLQTRRQLAPDDLSELREIRGDLEKQIQDYMERLKFEKSWKPVHAHAAQLLLRSPLLKDAERKKLRSLTESRLSEATKSPNPLGLKPSDSAGQTNDDLTRSREEFFREFVGYAFELSNARKLKSELELLEWQSEYAAIIEQKPSQNSGKEPCDLWHWDAIRDVSWKSEAFLAKPGRFFETLYSKPVEFRMGSSRLSSLDFDRGHKRLQFEVKVDPDSEIVWRPVRNQLQVDRDPPIELFHQGTKWASGEPQKINETGILALEARLNTDHGISSNLGALRFSLSPKTEVHGDLKLYWDRERIKFRLEPQEVKSGVKLKDVYLEESISQDGRSLTTVTSPMVQADLAFQCILQNDIGRTRDIVFSIGDNSETITLKLVPGRNQIPLDLPKNEFDFRDRLNWRLSEEGKDDVGGQIRFEGVIPKLILNRAENMRFSSAYPMELFIREGDRTRWIQNSTKPAKEGGLYEMTYPTDQGDLDSLEVQIGGYPRAFLVEKGEIKDPPSNAIYRVELEGVDASTQPRDKSIVQNLIPKTQDSNSVGPHSYWAGSKLQAIKVRTQLDGSPIIWQIERLSGETIKKGTWKDRSIRARKKIENKMLVIRYEVTELEEELDLIGDNVLFRLQSGAKSHEISVLRDKDPPSIGSLKVSGKEAILESKDLGSGLDGGEIRFREKTILGKVVAVDRIVFDLSETALDLSKCVVVTWDSVGNEQRGHIIPKR